MKCFFWLLILLFGSSCNAQDFVGAHPQGMALYKNLTYFQGDSLARANLYYRNQWTGLYGTYVIYGVSFAAYLSKLNGYLGVIYQGSIEEDELNIKGKRIGLNYSQNLRVGNDVLMRFGSEVSYVSRVLDPSRLIFEDNSNRYSTSSASIRGEIFQVGTVDVSLATSIFWKQWMLGVAVFHLTNPSTALFVGEQGLNRRVNINVSYDFQIEYGARILNIQPLFEYANQGEYESYRVGGLLKFRGIQLGTLYRNKDAFSVFSGYEFKNRARLTYCYDASVSRLTTATAGSHELALYYSFWRRAAHKNFKMVQGAYF